jgi:hypothetical protein
MNPDDLTQARSEARELLNAAADEQRISTEVLELRLALIGEAPSPAAVAAIVADLLPTGGYDQVPAVMEEGWVNPPDVIRLSATFGTTKRQGRWTAPYALELQTMFGELEIDLRDATFGSNVLEVDVNSFFGSIVITVPSGTEIENDCSTVFGSVSHQRKNRDAASANGLVVRITGTVVFGDLKTRERLPSDLAPPAPPGIRGWLARVTGQID